jgi:hypothetical protein
MAQQLIQELKMAETHKNLPGVECDSLSEFCLFMGDMNYRLNTDYAHLNTANINSSLDIFDTHDQLTLSKQRDNYPGYDEP